MKEPIIVYARGIWAEPNAVSWIANNIETATGIQVELFDYHEELVQNIDNQLYVKRVIEKFGDFYASKSDRVILFGHSHGGAFAIILNKNFGTKKLIVSNPALKPWGIFRHIPNTTKEILKNFGIGEGYTPHFIVKHNGEIEERLNYFKNNFNFIRDLSRILYVGKEANKLVDSIQNDFLIFQSLKDEMASVKVNLDFYDKINLPTNSSNDQEAIKKIIKAPNGEHAIMEEKDLYPDLYNELNNFIKRR